MVDRFQGQGESLWWWKNFDMLIKACKEKK